MQKMTQKEAVFQAVTHVTGHEGEGAVVISKEQRKQVNEILFASFRAGKIDLDRDYTDTDLRGYVSGLQSNWLRKDTRLNGGVKYEAKNPGSRAGSTDPQLKSMRALMVDFKANPGKYPGLTAEEIQGHIDAKVEAIAAAKAKPIDFSALPAELRAKFQK